MNFKTKGIQIDKDELEETYDQNKRNSTCSCNQKVCKKTSFPYSDSNFSPQNYTNFLINDVKQYKPIKRRECTENFQTGQKTNDNSKGPIYNLNNSIKNNSLNSLELDSGSGTLNEIPKPRDSKEKPYQRSFSSGDDFNCSTWFNSLEYSFSSPEISKSKSSRKFMEVSTMTSPGLWLSSININERKDEIPTTSETFWFKNYLCAFLHLSILGKALKEKKYFYFYYDLLSSNVKNIIDSIFVDFLVPLRSIFEGYFEIFSFAILLLIAYFYNFLTKNLKLFLKIGPLVQESNEVPDSVKCYVKKEILKALELVKHQNKKILKSKKSSKRILLPESSTPKKTRSKKQNYKLAEQVSENMKKTQTGLHFFPKFKPKKAKTLDKSLSNHRKLTIRNFHCRPRFLTHDKSKNILTYCKNKIFSSFSANGSSFKSIHLEENNDSSVTQNGFPISLLDVSEIQCNDESSHAFCSSNIESSLIDKNTNCNEDSHNAHINNDYTSPNINTTSMNVGGSLFGYTFDNIDELEGNHVDNDIDRNIKNFNKVKYFDNIIDELPNSDIETDPKNSNLKFFETAFPVQHSNTCGNYVKKIHCNNSNKNLAVDNNKKLAVENYKNLTVDMHNDQNNVSGNNANCFDNIDDESQNSDIKTDPKNSNLKFFETAFPVVHSDTCENYVEKFRCNSNQNLAIDSNKNLAAENYNKLTVDMRSDQNIVHDSKVNCFDNIVDESHNSVIKIDPKNSNMSFFKTTSPVPHFKTCDGYVKKIRNNDNNKNFGNGVHNEEMTSQSLDKEEPNSINMDDYFETTWPNDDSSESQEDISIRSAANKNDLDDHSQKKDRIGSKLSYCLAENSESIEMQSKSKKIDDGVENLKELKHSTSNCHRKKSILKSNFKHTYSYSNLNINEKLGQNYFKASTISLDDNKYFFNDFKFLTPPKFYSHLMERPHNLNCKQANYPIEAICEVTSMKNWKKSFLKSLPREKIGFVGNKSAMSGNLNCSQGAIEKQKLFNKSVANKETTPDTTLAISQTSSESIDADFPLHSLEESKSFIAKNKSFLTLIRRTQKKRKDINLTPKMSSLLKNWKKLQTCYGVNILKGGNPYKKHDSEC